MRALTLGSIAMLAIGAAANAARAGSFAGSAHTIQVSVLASCSVVSPANFGFGTRRSTRGTPPNPVSNGMSVTCLTGVPYHLAFVSPNDLDATGTAKAMKGVSNGNTEYVPYHLQIGAKIIGTQDGVNTLDSTGTGVPQNYNVTATITSWRTPTNAQFNTDTYIDRVTARIDF